MKFLVSEPSHIHIVNNIILSNIIFAFYRLLSPACWLWPTPLRMQKFWKTLEMPTPLATTPKFRCPIQLIQNKVVNWMETNGLLKAIAPLPLLRVRKWPLNTLPTQMATKYLMPNPHYQPHHQFQRRSWGRLITSNSTQT